MKRFGLIGHPVGHSRSAEMHNRWFSEQGIDARYDLIDLKSIEAFREVMAFMDGVNVTIPHKQSVMQFLDVISDEARAVGAVNTIVRRNGLLYGYNTDVDGFRALAQGMEHKKAIVLGTGGAAKAVVYVLSQMGCNIKSVSHKELDNSPVSIKGYDLIINATPLGMTPNTDSCPNIRYDEIEPQMTAIDIVYNPEETEFLKRFKSHGCETRGGMLMLIEQGKKAFRLFTENE